MAAPDCHIREWWHSPATVVLSHLLRWQGDGLLMSLIQILLWAGHALILPLSLLQLQWTASSVGLQGT